MFEARDKDFTDQWRQITGQVGCSYCRTALPPNAEYGHGKHAVADMRSRTLKIICDQCYVNVIENHGGRPLDRNEQARRDYVEDKLRRLREDLYIDSRREVGDYHRIPRKVRAGIAPQRTIKEKEIDYQPFIREAKKLGRALWEDLTGDTNGKREDYN